MDDMKLLSTEAEGVNEAIAEEHRKALVNGAGRVGALLGLQSPQDSSSASTDKEADSTGTAPTHSAKAKRQKKIIRHRYKPG